MSRSALKLLRRVEPLRLGYLPVSDCVPLVYASEAGLFEKYEIRVELHREISWGDIRDKVIEGELDAAHAPATLPFLANMGVDSDPCSCVSGLVLSLQGNAVTLSKELWESGVRDAASLRERIYQRWGRRTLTLGVGCGFSPQEIVLRRWLASGGIVPGREVRIVAVPPTQMFPNLRLGYLDGYCVGEPWSTLAVQAGAAVCVATSAELAPLHPEKVLMARQSFAIGRADEHERLIAALLEACAFCDQPENRPLLSRMLAHKQYLNAPEDCIQAGLVGPVDGNDHRIRSLFGLTIFHGHNANDPDDTKAAWLVSPLSEMVGDSAFKYPLPSRTPVVKNVFRRDIYLRAKSALLDQVRQIEQEANTFESRDQAQGE